MIVSICIITYKRENKLQQLLESLNYLEFHKIGCPEIEVIVVDNDIEGVAEKVCSRLRSEFRWQLKTAVEPQRGITYARNKSVALASPDSDFIAIIDDDEFATPTWLENLLLTQEKYQADVVSAPSIPYFDDPNVPRWIVEGNFFMPSRWRTGTELFVAYTHNVLVRAEILRQLNPVFDNRFAISGGEDTHLFFHIQKMGYKIVWSDEAIMYDTIPVSRTNLKWILLRGYRTWSDHSSFEKEMYPSFIRQFVRALKGIALIVLGVMRLISGLVMGKAALVKGFLFISRGLGTWGGLLNINYQEYKNI